MRGERGTRGGESTGEGEGAGVEPRLSFRWQPTCRGVPCVSQCQPASGAAALVSPGEGSRSGVRQSMDATRERMHCVCMLGA